MTEELEYELINQSDETWVVSSSERRLLKDRWPHKSVQVVSNIVDVPGSNTPFSLRRDWLFIGGFQHTPNVDAVLFFVQEIYPLWATTRRVKFYITTEIVASPAKFAGLQRCRPFIASLAAVAPLHQAWKKQINQTCFRVPVDDIRL